jgi:hypothetical protein
MTQPLIGHPPSNAEQDPSSRPDDQPAGPPAEENAPLPAEPAQSGLPPTEEAALEALGLEGVPRGFEWSARQRAWVREVAVAPDSTDGLHPIDAEQLALWVSGFNDRVGSPALQLRVSGPDGP